MVVLFSYMHTVCACEDVFERENVDTARIWKLNWRVEIYEVQIKYQATGNDLMLLMEIYR